MTTPYSEPWERLAKTVGSIGSANVAAALARAGATVQTHQITSPVSTDRGVKSARVEEPGAMYSSTDGVTTVTVYLGLGNSDGKLNAREWAGFIDEISALVTSFGDQLYGWWASEPFAPWQNAMCGFTIETANIHDLKVELAEVRARYKQNSLAWAQVPRTVFV